MNRQLLSLVKLALVAGLMVLVFTSIQWTDRLTVVTADGQVLDEQVGTILGEWDAEELRFRPQGSDTARSVRPGERADGALVKVSPGFLTFLRGLDLVLFALGASCYFFTVSVASVRWWWLLRVNDLDVRWTETLRYSWIGCFFNNVVPGQTGGDVVKALYIMKRCEGGRLRAIVSVLVDRILGLGSLALLAAVVVLFALDRFQELALAIWGVLAAVGAMGVVAFSRRIRRLVRLDQILRRLPPALRGPLQRLDQAVFFYRAHKTGILAWLLVGVFNHALSVTGVVLIGRALGLGLPGEGVPVYEYFVLVPVIVMVSAVPIGPNGWGVGEVLYAYLFGTYCAGYLGPSVANPVYVMRTQAVALSVLYRIHLTLWSLLGGILVLLGKDRVTRAEVQAEIEREEREIDEPGASQETPVASANPSSGKTLGG